MASDWLKALDGPDYHWEVREPPATEDEIAAFEQFLGMPLPDDYTDFLRCYNGGGLWRQDIWCLHLLRVSEIPSWASAYGFERAPGAIPFGSDGGGEALVFDMRVERPDSAYPIYAINFVSIDWEAAILVAPDFRSLLLSEKELFSA